MPAFKSQNAWYWKTKANELKSREGKVEETNSSVNSNIQIFTKYLFVYA